MERPTVTDPYFKNSELQWRKASDGAHYFWSQPVEVDITLNIPPLKIDCENGNTLEVYLGPSKQELLYRFKLNKKPKRFMLRPYDHTIFWTYGTDGGPSFLVKYLYRDKYLSMHKWEDKDSFLAVIRTNHYANYDYAFWSR